MLPIVLGIAQSNGVIVTMDLDPGWLHRLESSTNLVDWFDLTNVISTNATIRLEDVMLPATDRQFFRGRSP